MSDRVASDESTDGNCFVKAAWLNANIENSKVRDGFETAWLLMMERDASFAYEVILSLSCSNVRRPLFHSEQQTVSN